MQTAIIAGLMFRHALERLPLDMRALSEMLGCVDDIVTALREYQQEAQWSERRRLDEAYGLVSAAPNAALPQV
jgi:hypothetical protein